MAFLSGEFVVGASRSALPAGTQCWRFASQAERSAFLYGAGISEDPTQPAEGPLERLD